MFRIVTTEISQNQRNFLPKDGKGYILAIKEINKKLFLIFVYFSNLLITQ
jgi:hypothetical protein